MNTKAIRRSLLIAVPLLLTFFVLKGYSKFTEGNFEKIHNGMTTDEVKAVLGSPTSEVIQTDYQAFDGLSGGPADIAFQAENKVRHARRPLNTTYNYINSSTRIEIDFARDIVVSKKGTFK